MNKEDLLEVLADLEHEQWIKWSKDIAEKEKLSPERIARWKSLWIPYLELSEEMKEHDRVWARKALQILKMNEHMFINDPCSFMGCHEHASHHMYLCDIHWLEDNRVRDAYQRGFAANFSPETREWLKTFMKFHRMESLQDAVELLIDNYKAWNRRLFDDDNEEK